MYSEALPDECDNVILRASRGTAEGEEVEEALTIIQSEQHRLPLVRPAQDPAPTDFMWFTLSTFGLLALMCLVFAALWSYKEIVGIVFLTLIAAEKAADIRRRLYETH
jgi:hypothetical protein